MKIKNPYKITYRKFSKAVRNNMLIALFLGLIIVGGGFLVYKHFSSSQYVYVKVKLQEGYWIINSLKNAQKGKPDLKTKIINIEYYPNWQPGQLDVYINMKLDAKLNKSTNEYSYDYSTLSTGSPIQIHLKNLDTWGTIVDMSNKPFNDKYVYKTVYLVDRGGYTKDFPYMFGSINVGDKYFDGSNIVFEVLDKKLEKNVIGVWNNLDGQVYEHAIDTTQNIIVKARIRVKQTDNKFIYEEIYEIKINNSIPFSTDNFFLNDFVIRNIE